MGIFTKIDLKLARNVSVFTEGIYACLVKKVFSKVIFSYVSSKEGRDYQLIIIWIERTLKQSKGNR